MTDYRDGAFSTLDGFIVLALAVVFLTLGALCAPAITRFLDALHLFGG